MFQIFQIINWIQIEIITWEESSFFKPQHCSIWDTQLPIVLLCTKEFSKKTLKMPMLKRDEEAHETDVSFYKSHLDWNYKRNNEMKMNEIWIMMKIENQNIFESNPSSWSDKNFFSNDKCTLKFSKWQHWIRPECRPVPRPPTPTQPTSRQGFIQESGQDSSGRRTHVRIAIL